MVENVHFFLLSRPRAQCRTGAGLLSGPGPDAQTRGKGWDFQEAGPETSGPLFLRHHGRPAKP